VVATSGNLSDEPICIDEQEAVRRLGPIADAFLVHNRPIARHVDDSIVRVILGRELVLRRARGYAPLPVHLDRPVSALLAVGGHLKNVVAASVGRDVFLSQHIGDLETAEALGAFRRVIADFEKLYDLQPAAMACDGHPDYLSTQFALRSGLPVTRVQHHYAHVLACMAENGLVEPVLGVSWDGTGYGLDHSLWGGEFLRITERAFDRVASFRPFRLPGGERAIREPRRAALGLLYELFGQDLFQQEDLPPVRAFRPPERPVLERMLARRLNTPVTTSVGRLFDVVAALLALRLDTQFEGQAAMELEWSLEGTATDEAYPFPLRTQEAPALLDWEPAIRQVLRDLRDGQSAGTIAAKFHNGLAEAVVTVAQWVGESRVVLTGGCFQNRYLTERTVRRLIAAGFSPLWHQRVPPNDGGIALGQILAAARAKE
jgi:hydrogenase maturation protein HypF